MSPSSSKPLPNFLRQLTPQRVLSILRQPSAIALLASIGVHGLLAVTLPLLPMKSEEPKKPRAVKVVALTPAERSRLPSGFGSGSGSGLKSGNSLLSDLPPSLLIPPPSPLYTYPTTAPLETYPVEQTRPDPVPENPTSSESGTKPSDKSPTGGNTGKTRNQGNSTGNQGNSTGNQGSGNGSSGNNVPVCPTPPDSSPACKEQRLRELYTFDPTDISYDNERYEKALVKPLSELSKGKKEKDFDTIFVPLPYPEEACRYIPKNKQEKKTSGIILILQPDGQLAGTLQVFISSGYKALNEAALKYVTDKIKNPDRDEWKPSKKGNYKGILATLEFDPETICAAKP